MIFLNSTGGLCEICLGCFYFDEQSFLSDDLFKIWMNKAVDERQISAFEFHFLEGCTSGTCDLAIPEIPVFSNSEWKLSNKVKNCNT